MTTARSAREVAVVTGASGGIGRAIALALARDGTALGLIGRRAAGLEDVARLGRRSSPRLITYEADISLDDDLQRVVTQLRKDWPVVDALIHCAGAYARSTVMEGRLEDLDHQYRVNVRAAYALSAALLPLMRPAAGDIVFINSSVGLRAAAALGGYAGTKHALRALADALREEVNERGIRILSVFVGRTATPLQAHVHQLEGRPYHPERLLQPDDVASVVRHALRLPRTAEVTEITIRPLQKPGAAHSPGEGRDP